jgi:membrane fusion protein, copper/silver efflux system
MNRIAIFVLLATTSVAGISGYWAGRDGAAQPFNIPAASAAETATGSIIYYRDPDGKPDYSVSPKKSANGRDFVPVRASEEVSFASAAPPPATAKNGPKRIRYYRNPMGLPDTSPVPKKDSMGMDYIPVYEGDEEDGSTVKISPGKLQRTGVRSERVTRRVLTMPIRAPGVVQADEHRQSVVALRFDAFIERLEHVTTGDQVHQGEPLMRLYSSALSSAAAEYLTDLAARDSTALPSDKGAAASRKSRHPRAVDQRHRARQRRYALRRLARASRRLRHRA